MTYLKYILKKLGTILAIAILCNSFSGCKGQTQFGANLLHLEQTIPLPGVSGRIDHMDINLKAHLLYVAALANNTVEVIDLLNGKVIYSITSLNEPQGVCYIPQTNEIFIANGGNGDCYFYNAATFEKVATIHLSSDADDVRYDAAERKVYVGYGTGGIAVISAETHLKIGDVKLPGHPESFQMDKSLNRLFVNVPDAHMVAVIDLLQLKLTDKWVRNSPLANFPMAVDTVLHRVFIGYRHPSKLMALDCKTGNEISSADMIGDADDVYYDNRKAEIFVSGGDGEVNIYKEDSTSTYKQIANISTSAGARTSLLVPENKLFILAAKASSGKPAKILVYKISE